MSDERRSAAEGAEAEDPREADQDEGLRGKLEGLVPDIIRRTVAGGIAAVLSSDESVRRLATEFSLPKDVAAYLIRQAQRSREEVGRIVAQELRRFLENLNLSDELVRVLTALSFEIKTEIRFIPNDKKLPRPSVKQSVAVKRSGRGRKKKDDAPA